MKARKARKPRQKKVWRIFRFEERFELPDDSRFCRKGPLQFIRGFVGSGQTDEAINFKIQIATCKASPSRHRLLASFHDLLDIAANHSRYLRGYLLDERFEPASNNKIAVWIGLNSTEACKILKELEQIGLIEKVSMPHFDPALNELPEISSEEREKSRGKKSGSRRRSRKHGKSRAPFKKREGKSGSGNGKDNKNSSSGKTPEEEKIPEKKKAKQNTTAQAVSEGLRQKQDDPINPKEPDAGVGKIKTGRSTDPPQTSFVQQSGQPIRLDMALQRHYNLNAKKFAHAVYKAIGTRYSIDSDNGRSEIGCFETAWLKAQLTGINPIYLAGLWDRTMQEAASLNLKRKRIKFTKSPEAVLRVLFDKFLDKAIQKASHASEEQLRAINTG